ncbi:ABC transporter substrate-binding protein [Paenibacillus lignilyticus]|uniref:ABC transporter substrate-binding protein n=1 Tax=Paenibacillus lignilyticus TaxID=1172615 RepID=A0ABS5CII4_9BACL|nr:ABC transporter substrate-binding protein [Paenibacillus lignilyticus]MBP3965674.1 ABC transporter substrate-binding protein [Paenibacillus lignilyticus]
MISRKRKSYSAVALTCALGLVLTGCGSNGNNVSNSSNANGDTTKQANAANTTAATDNETKTNEPAAPKLEEADLTLYYPGSPQKDEQEVEAAVNEYLKDKINAKLDLMPIDWGSWDSKINLMISSSQPADIIFTAAWNGFTVNVGKGAFLDLTDLIDEYGKDMKAVMNPAFLSGSKVNGRNYGIPTNKELAATRGLLLRKDIVEKYGFDLSTIHTTADLEPMLKTVKEKEADMTPFYVSSDSGLLTNLNFDTLGDNSVPGVLHKIGTETTILNEPSTPEFKDAAALSRKWYQAGYINKDAATTKVKPDELMKAGKVFSYTASLKPGAAEEVMRSVGVPLVQVELTEPTTTTGDTTGSMLAISRTSKNPERAMMLINLLHTDKTLNNLINYGIEGKHYVKVEGANDVIKYPDGVDAATSTYSPGTNWQIGNQFLNFLFDTENPKKWDMFKTFNDSAKPSIALGFTFNSDSVKSEVAACVNVYKEYFGTLNAGTVDPDKYIAQFLDKLKASGVDKIIAEKQKQFDEWNKSKG